MPENFLAISALQHYAYCPRQFALIHVEQAWAENRFTAEGRILHERVDSNEAEQRKDIRYERSVLVKSEQYRIQGKMDLLEVHGRENKRYFPVEYKRGKPKTDDWDRLQLCAQALCIEEMRDTRVEEGAIWYWEARKRESVIIDDALRRETIDAISQASDIRERAITPPPTSQKKRCQGCSLYHLCEPNLFSKDWSANYIESIGE
ncbi:CRISPR-associated protein Cas4 [Leucothrix pacifica]|uniref:CRISPR-associated exonuclease Cas4 n=1 Tax=Leucothrix pacifica TaxID=1247513 RepID=A0A317C6T9_9GAMM|nr:CRISPR-associated protein Cas4 [Leucothrix pacifica]PWQ94027.1 CRISPR-associated protein Cas4 [Leucothrix pacifica]